MSENKFIIDFKQPTTYGFTAVALNYFVEEILKKREDLKSKHLYFRLFRTGVIGDILYKKGEEYIESEEHEPDNELIAALFESYLFLARTVFDYLLHFLKEQYGVKESSFYAFLKKVESGHYPEIKGKFREHLINSKFFEEIRALRDSIKRQTPYIFVYVKDNKYRVEGTIYNRSGEKKESFDEELRLKMFGYSTALLILMAYIAESMTGFTLKEQIAHQKKHSKTSAENEL